MFAVIPDRFYTVSFNGAISMLNEINDGRLNQYDMGVGKMSLSWFNYTGTIVPSSLLPRKETFRVIMNRYAFTFRKGQSPKFFVGDVVITPGAKHVLTHEEILQSLQRHMLGDWGDLDDEDKEANDSAVAAGGRILSKFASVGGVEFYIITEADRSVTTLLLPEEY